MATRNWTGSKPNLESRDRNVIAAYSFLESSVNLVQAVYEVVGVYPDPLWFWYNVTLCEQQQISKW